MIYVVAQGLHDEGRVDLDAPVTAYSRLALSQVYTNVTLRDLMDHRSGLPREFLGFRQMWDALSSGMFGTDIYRSSSTKERLYRELNKPKWQDGVRQKTAQYSSVGFGLLGVLLEDATGDTLEQLLQRYVCAPLGLTDTTFEPDEEQRRRLATPCAGDLPWFYRRSSPVTAHDLGDGMRAAGCIFSTPRDLVRFAEYYRAIVHASQPLAATENEDLVCCCRVGFEEGRPAILYRIGMYYGYANFVGFDLATQASLFIFRNNTDWPDLDGVKILRAIAARAGPPPAQ